MTTFTLPPLPFDERALEPQMSAETLRFHHGKHHATYIKNVNAAFEGKQAPDTIEAVVLLAAETKDQKLFNNSAQAWNHGFFWQSLAPETSAPGSSLAAAINASFGGQDAFTKKFAETAAGHFGSGWVWLVSDAKGALSLQSLHDAATPLTDANVTPLLTLDVWEHAYYVDYRNDRAKFIDAFLTKLANWSFATQQYAAARNDGAGAWRFPT